MPKTIQLELTARSPLNIGDQKPYGHFLETLDYIPGSVIRGAFAKVLQQNNPTLFNQLFVTAQDVVRFGNCYPTTVLNASDVPRVLPKTAVSCKYQDGFCTGYEEIRKRDPQTRKQAGIDESTPTPHGVFDTLITELIFQEFGDQLPFTFQPRCPRCQARVEPFVGYYDEHRLSPSDRPSYLRGKCKTQRVTKSAIDRKRNVVQEEMLYAVSAIRPLQSFRGFVTVRDDSLFDDVRSHLRHLETGRLGGGGSRGFGKVRRPRIENDRPDTESEIKSQIVAFNESIHTVALFYGAFCQNPTHLEGSYFTIGLQSDALFRDELDRNTLVLTVEMLKGLLNQPSANIALKRYYSSMTEKGGWSWKWKLFKERDAMVEKGSVFLFWTDDIQPLYAPLTCLQAEGIGERRDEGFGEIIICDPFHLEVDCS